MTESKFAGALHSGVALAEQLYPVLLWLGPACGALLLVILVELIADHQLRRLFRLLRRRRGASPLTQYRWEVAARIVPSLAADVAELGDAARARLRRRAARLRQAGRRAAGQDEGADPEAARRGERQPERPRSGRRDGVPAPRRAHRAPVGGTTSWGRGAWLLAQ